MIHLGIFFFRMWVISDWFPFGGVNTLFVYILIQSA